MSSLFVNRVSRGRVFTGEVVRSPVTKNPPVAFSSSSYVISSAARGKELALTLQCRDNPLNRVRLLFRFGMSGRFMFHPASDIPKHAHLQWFTRDTPPSALCFVDYRRFGSWREAEGWGQDRGPDPMYEYALFRRHVLGSLQHAAFNRPVCEAMLNQAFFNGIGNYLRAEILYRCIHLWQQLFVYLLCRGL